MFTVKLYAEGKCRLIEADAVTVYWYNSSAAQISIHRNAKFDGTVADEALFVGYPDSTNIKFSESTLWWAEAYVENAAGRTTESIRPAAIPSTVRVA